MFFSRYATTSSRLVSLRLTSFLMGNAVSLLANFRISSMERKSSSACFGEILDPGFCCSVCSLPPALGGEAGFCGDWLGACAQKEDAHRRTRKRAHNFR